MSRLIVSAAILGLLAHSHTTPLSQARLVVSPSGVVAAPVTRSAPDQSSKAKILETYSKLPLSFETNQGQTDGRVKFLARGSGYTLFLTPTEAVLVLKQQSAVSSQQSALKTQNSKPQTLNSGPPTPDSGLVLRMQLVGANPQPQVAGLEGLPGKSHYFIGNNPRKWRTDVPTYAKVQYKDIYPGIDLIYYGNQRQLEYDFVVAPGADPKTITLGFQGVDKIEVDAQGDLVLHTAGGEIRQHKPLVYQEIHGTQQAIPSRYVFIGEDQVGFHLAAYDPTKPLVIDPALSYSTYLGGSDDDIGRGIAVDADGNAYVTGSTLSTNFPTANPLQPAFGGGDLPFGGDAFVTKLDPTGSTLVYSTYLGGSDDDIGHYVAVDADGNAYVTGSTLSTNFPTVNPLQPAFGGGDLPFGGDAFATKLDPTGSALVYSTYLGGSDDDIGHGIAVDADGNAYVTGETFSTNFPTANPLQPAFGGGDADAFVTKLNRMGSRLVYSTYLGGRDNDIGRGIAVDAAGSAHVTGETSSTNFPKANPLQRVFRRGDVDAFMTKLDPTGSALVYSTRLGGRDDDIGLAIAVDTDGNAYVTGETFSTNFPTVNPLQPDSGGGADAFAAKLDPTGSALVYSTYLGGSDDDIGRGIAVDAAGSAHVTGETFSLDFPTVNPLQPDSGGGADAFAAKLDPTGSALVYSTYLGGSDDDVGIGIAVDAAGNTYATGFTFSTDFPTVSPFQAAFGGSRDAYVAKITDIIIADLSVTKTDSPDPVIVGNNLTYTVTVTNNGPSAATGVMLVDTLPTGVTFVSATPSQGSCSGTSTVTCNLGDLDNGATATVTIVITPTASPSQTANSGGAKAAPVTSSVSSRHTHFRYGHITWKPRPDIAPTAIEFTFTGAFRRDGYSGSASDGFPQTGDIISEDIGSTQLCFGDGECTGTLKFQVTAFDPAQNWIIGQAVPGPIIHTYPSTGDFTAFTESCCRISSCVFPNAHINNPDGDYRVETLVNVGTGNSSPVSSLPPIVLCSENGLCSFSIPASDNEGDPLTFRLSTGTESDLNRQPGPPDCPNTATVDPITGDYTWDTTGCTVGTATCGSDFDTLYSTQVTIEDGAGKAALDFFIQLIPCPPDNNPPVFDSPPTPVCGSTIPANPGDLVAFTTQASDPDSGDTVELNVGGLPLGATMTPPLPTSGSPVSSNFSWTPTADQTGQHVVTFTATDQCGAQVLCSVTIGVTLVTITNTATVAGNEADPDTANNTAMAVTTINVAPSLSIDDVTVTEGDSGTVNVVFTVTLSAASSQTVTVDFATADGTAIAGLDYVTTSGTLTFSAGTTTQNVTVTVKGDTLDEPNEIFFVNLTNPTNATISDSQGVCTIIDNDPIP